jgi:hypothetical protein
MKTIIISILCLCNLALKAQDKIIYKFDKPVIDSLQIGIQKYEKGYHKSNSEIKLYATILERDGDIEIYLLEYSSLPPGGLLKLIKSTNREIKISDDFSLPVLFPSDRLSSNIIDDKIRSLPLSGFYVKISYLNYKVSTIQTATLF